MIYANNEQGMKIQAAPNVEGWCPACNEKLISKCGEIRIWHFSHIGGADCDPWHEPMTKWHIDWQRLFPEEWREIVVSRPNGRLLECDPDTKHRADILLPCGVAIEFQHSPISVEMIKAREVFYQRIIWVFDVVEAYQAGRFEVWNKGKFHTFVWKHCKMSVSFCQHGVVFDLGKGQIFNTSKIYPAESETVDHYGISKAKPMGGWGHIMEDYDFIEYLRQGKNL